MFADLSLAEQVGVNTELSTFLLPYRYMGERQTEVGIHMSLVNSFINTNNIISFNIIPIPGSSCCNLLYKLS